MAKKSYEDIVNPKNYGCKCDKKTCKCKAKCQCKEKSCRCEENKWADVLERAWKIRTFEIETSWKRTNYFSIVVGALFIGYYTIASKSGFPYNPNNAPPFFVTILITLLGFIASLTWFFINKGSKFWQEHWEINIDEIENAMGHNKVHSNVFTKNKYSAIHPSKTYPFSVSKLNMMFSLIVTIAWGILFIYEFTKKFNINISKCIVDFIGHIGSPFIITLVVLFFITVLIWRMGSSQYTKKETVRIEGTKNFTIGKEKRNFIIICLWKFIRWWTKEKIKKKMYKKIKCYSVIISFVFIPLFLFIPLFPNILLFLYALLILLIIDSYN